MKSFWSKWTISASSGLFGKLLFLIIVLCGGIVGSAYLLPEESAITKAMSTLVSFFVITVTMQFFFNLHTFKEWSREIRADRIKEQELRNEELKLKIELEKHQKKRQFAPDNEE